MDKSLNENGRVSRTIKVEGTRKKTITSDALTWGELKVHLESEEIDVDNMKAVLGSSKLTLELNQSVLPDGNFVLHLLPQRTKAGIDIDGMFYGDLRIAIKEAFNSNSTRAGEHFNQNKNYTNKPTQELKELLKEWYGENGGITPVQQNTELGKKVFQAPIEQEAEKETPTISSILGAKIHNIEQVIEEIENLMEELNVEINEEDNIHDELSSAVNSLEDSIDSLNTSIGRWNNYLEGSSDTEEQINTEDSEHEELKRLFR